mmetsp:Transcript_36556/g.60553  ORF Transcript_36556/g.60553 Transcript_36556/m.60553 type:complete len:292 (+) Transcript_36556:89-964(+)|eukprot:CAMPEP_0119303434 /NCGR_PEP_ID=MMETSP1333-20130426/4859_1 /TAXON_ID=418940 /ORGANISM="Scyphosphaera apsteinii, Strain RCC1455" /LENGTH=291 /DNA_ID=CAMNT_0007306097 /DNA_START=89 /DNA_END=964 /DNA_ORIENTATION=-
MRRRLHTLASAVEVRGIGLHTGMHAHVRLLPAKDGITFCRTDLNPKQLIPAKPQNVMSTRLSTTLGVGRSTVGLVEHLMSAFGGIGVSACRVEVNSAELPVLDGSALPWIKAINSAGLVRLTCEPEVLYLRQPVIVQEASSWALAHPAQTTRLTCGIDFPRSPIGRQWHSWGPADGCFAREIAPARTFALGKDLQSMQEDGLIRGGSLACALVCDANRWLNGPLRFANEPARHKLLDLLGDLALLGSLPRMHVIAYRGSHRLHVMLARRLAIACKGHANESATWTSRTMLK